MLARVLLLLRLQYLKTGWKGTDYYLAVSETIVKHHCFWLIEHETLGECADLRA